MGRRAKNKQSDPVSLESTQKKLGKRKADGDIENIGKPTARAVKKIKTKNLEVKAKPAPVHRNAAKKSRSMLADPITADPDLAEGWEDVNDIKNGTGYVFVSSSFSFTYISSDLTWV